MQTLKVGIPKGSLQDSTFDLFKRAGFDMNLSSSRSYFPSVDDKELSCIMFRAQEMSRYVQDNIVDVGITGHDWIKENQSDVVEICELVYSKANRQALPLGAGGPEGLQDHQGGGPGRRPGGHGTGRGHEAVLREQER